MLPDVTKKEESLRPEGKEGKLMMEAREIWPFGRVIHHLQRGKKKKEAVCLTTKNRLKPFWLAMRRRRRKLQPVIKGKPAGCDDVLRLEFTPAVNASAFLPSLQGLSRGEEKGRRGERGFLGRNEKGCWQ